MTTPPSPRKPRAGTRGKPFEPGNPGRARGSRNRVTLAVEALLEGEHEQLTRKAIELALKGDGPALRLCLERLAPARRDAPVTVDMPPVRSAADTVEASSAILKTVAAGEITPDEAGRLMTLLTAHRTIIVAGDLEQRIQALEEKAK